jgi:hypothetical protein
METEEISNILSFFYIGAVGSPEMLASATIWPCPAVNFDRLDILSYL